MSRVLGSKARKIELGSDGRGLAVAIPFVLAALVASGCGEASNPNVVLIVLDTTRGDFLSSYGHSLPSTPEIDRLAADGARYTRAFSTCDLAGRLPDVERELLSRLRAWEAALGPDARAEPLESADAEALERLRALGYVE